MSEKFTKIRNVRMLVDGTMQFDVWDNVEHRYLSNDKALSGDFCCTKKIEVQKLLDASEFVDRPHS